MKIFLIVILTLFTSIELTFAKTTQPTNILWLVVEDMSPILEVYGHNVVKTPAISQLAKEGVTYTNVFSTSGVCAPSRAALTLGMYPSGVSANNMRTNSYTEVTGLPKYEAVPPVEAKMLSHYMRAQGYYTSNNDKEDYQFTPPKAAWHESSPYAHWRNRKANQPFYSVFNFGLTHESGLFEPYGFKKIKLRHYFHGDNNKINSLASAKPATTTTSETPVHVDQKQKFPVPPYLPDNDVVQRDLWKMYNNLVETDKQIGAIIQQLKDDGLYDSTIIVFYADHGGPLPRQKRLVYDSGLKVPMIIKFPNSQYAGTKDDQLISFVDFAPTTIKLAGVTIPAHMHGKDFIGSVKNLKDKLKKREYIHAAADRFDGFTDTIRAVRDDRFKYIRNYQPEQSYYLPITYRERIPTMKSLLSLKEEGKLNEIQMQWFRTKKAQEELFDIQNDPHELNNLAQDPTYQPQLVRFRAELARWLTEIGDQPGLPEAELIKALWHGQEQQPVTAAPKLVINNGYVEINSDTEGAVISYQIIPEAKSSAKHWLLYSQPFAISENSKIKAVAHRIGYVPSQEITKDIKKN